MVNGGTGTDSAPGIHETSRLPVRAKREGLRPWDGRLSHADLQADLQADSQRRRFVEEHAHSECKCDILPDEHNDRPVGRPGLHGTAGQKALKTAKLETASVLVPFIRRPHAPTILLTLRARHMRNHAGQVCLPGGRPDDGDRSLCDTALREFNEELGIAPDQVLVLGYLPDVISKTGFCVTPYVGVLDPPIHPRPEPAEVDTWFEAPISFISDARNWRYHEPDGNERGWLGYWLRYDRFTIWGVTADILWTLRQFWLGIDELPSGNRSPDTPDPEKRKRHASPCTPRCASTDAPDHLPVDSQLVQTK